MLANSHAGIAGAIQKAPRRVSHLLRRNDPGSGASTIYHDIHYNAPTDIKAGSEIFVVYGDLWFAGREESIGLIPLSQDFADADQLLSRLMQLLNEAAQSGIAGDLLHIVSSIVANRPRLQGIIPRDLEGLERSVQSGTANLTVPDRVRTKTWLEQNGRCMDNIRPDTSTVRHAGMGAFATRRIRKGEVIAPLPLVHFRRHHLEVYDAEDPHDPQSSVWPVGQQLLLNYCYGHAQSSLLLFPYAPVVNYVNHNLSHYNADLRWSTLPNHHGDWLDRTPDDLMSEEHSGLVMELIATRDIERGQEIQLSYGMAWDNAWHSHVRNWSPTDEDEHHVSVDELNEHEVWLRTATELEEEPYQFSNSDDVVTVCFVHSLEGDRYDDDGLYRTVTWTGSSDLFNTADNAHECTVQSRHYDDDFDLGYVYRRVHSIRPVSVTYTVLIEREDDMARVENVPRIAIRFFDKEYKADYLSRSAFRHEIHIPDHIFPSAWRDLS
jgi:SET domain